MDENGKIYNLDAYRQEKNQSVINDKVMMLVSFSDKIDNEVMSCIKRGSDIVDVAGILAHRLGAILAQMPNKEEILKILLDIAYKKAGLRVD